MTASSILFAALRGSLVLAVALAAMPLLRTASAATRRMVLVFAFAVVVVMPLATAVLPSLHLGDAAVVETHVTTASVPESIVESTGALAAPATTPNASAPIASTPTTSWAPSPLAIVLALWALGAIAVLTRLGAGLYRARRMVKSARLVEVRRIDVRTGAASRTAASHTGAASHTASASRTSAPSGTNDRDAGSRVVEIRSSAAIDTPAVTGVFTPVVLLPRDADTWTDERRELVLAHELAHVARRDCLASVVAQIAVAMHWFDPLAWIAARRLRIERELAADDRVLDSGATPSSYAEHLLALATAHGDHAVPAGALAMAEPAQVSVRIRALLAPTHSRAPLGRARLVSLGAVGALVATAIACTTPEPAPAPPTLDPAATREAPKLVAAIPDAGAVGTIDPAVQAIVDQETERLAADWGPCAAVVVVMDPATGNVLAISHSGGTEATAQLAGERPIVPGSTVKPLVIAAALEERVIGATDRFDASPLPMSMHAPVIKDATPNGVLDVREILAVSSNVGLAKIFDKLGGAKLAAWTKRFRLASAPATIEDGAKGAVIAIGANLTSTPLEITAAYAMLANGGTYHAPTFVPHDVTGERVLSAQTADTVVSMLEGVTSDRGTGKSARVEGIRIGGKTGTVHLGQDPESKDYYSSFVGIAPLDGAPGAPRYVVFVGAETPRDGGSGGKVAAPVFSRIVTRLIAR